MHTFKSVFGVLRAIVPVVYCGGLVYFFYDQAGSLQQAEDMGLGPTLLGLSVVGVLLCIPLMISIVRLVAGRRPPSSDGRDGPDSPNGGDDDSGFDADAVVARYMAQRSAEAAAGPSIAPPRSGGQPPKRTGFGRKIR